MTVGVETRTTTTPDAHVAVPFFPRILSRMLQYMSYAILTHLTRLILLEEDTSTELSRRALSLTSLHTF